MEAEEENRLLDEQTNLVALNEELEHDENTKWLRGCKWPIDLLRSLSIRLSLGQKHFSSHSTSISLLVHPYYEEVACQLGL